MALIRAETTDLDRLVPLSRAYHEFEQISLSDDVRRRGLKGLLDEPSRGAIWFVRIGGRDVGYIAICTGYSIEFGGPDAFIDEFFLEPEARGKGVGSFALEEASRLSREMGLCALHLEVDHDNEPAKRAYLRSGFKARSKYLFMSKELVDVGHTEG